MSLSSQNMSPIRTLLSLPSELLLLIGQHTINNDNFKDLYRLLCTNRHLSRLLQPLLFRASIRRDQGTVPLCFAVITGNIALARMLIDKYSVPLDRLRRSRTVLHEAVVNGTLEMTQLLLSAGANPNLLGISRESYGLNYPFRPPEWTALHFAVGRQLSYRGEAVDPATTEAMVRLLVKHGADIDSMGKRGETPLSLVVSDAVSHVSRARRFDERYRQFRYPPKDPFSGIGIESRRWLARVLLELGADKLVALDNEFVFNFTSNYQVEDIWLVKEHLDAIDAERLGGAEDSTPRFSLMDFTFQ